MDAGAHRRDRARNARMSSSCQLASNGRKKKRGSLAFQAPSLSGALRLGLGLHGWRYPGPAEGSSASDDFCCSQLEWPRHLTRAWPLQLS